MILVGPPKAKASFQVKTDVEGRRRWERKGLDTPVVNAVNDECLRLVIILFYLRIDKIKIKISLEMKMLSTSPGEYCRKAETQNIRRSWKPAVKHVI